MFFRRLILYVSFLMNPNFTNKKKKQTLCFNEGLILPVADKHFSTVFFIHDKEIKTPEKENRFLSFSTILADLFASFTQQKLKSSINLLYYRF